MEVLYFFESIRNPVLDAIVSVLTRLGEEAIFMGVALLMFWCINKFEGYYLMSVGFFGTVINQFLKIAFRIPRPWVQDPNFSIVESAREEATGYSFPSGHTQSSIGVFGGLAVWNKGKILKAICIACCIIVPLSRLYLGVHTPLDVGVSIVVALILILGFKPLVKKSEEKPLYMWCIIAAMFITCISGLLYVNLYSFPADIDPENLLSAKDNFCKLTGSLLAMAVVYFVDTKYTKFETKATFLGQVLKFGIGIILTLTLQTGLKPIMNLMFGDSPFRHIVRYFIVVLFAGCIWPLTFKKFSKIGETKD